MTPRKTPLQAEDVLDPPSPAPDPAMDEAAMVTDTAHPDGTRKRVYRKNGPKPTRSMQVIALLFVGIITAGCIAALAYSLAVNGSSTAEQQIGNMGLIGLGSLATLLGYKAASAAPANSQD